MGEVMNIIELAKRVGYPIQHPEWQKATEEFAALVAAHEREECAKIAEIAEPYQAADLIRARGQA
jgi:hypothetical protein